MNILNCMMDHILYQIFNTIFSISSKKHETLTYNTLIKVCINRAENRITFIIILGYYLELLTPETTKLLKSTVKWIGKEKIVKMCHQ